MKSFFRLFRQFVFRWLANKGTLNCSFYEDAIIIAPHPDDEVLGCGGYIAQAVKRGSNIKVVVLTDGGGSHDNCCQINKEKIKRERRKLTHTALECLGLESDKIIFLGWDDGKLPLSGHPDFGIKVDELARIFTGLKPVNVFCPHPFEGWADHVGAQEITLDAIKRSSIRTSLYYYCIWFWVSMPLRKGLMCDWRNAVVLDVSDGHKQKQNAINNYLRLCAPCGNPWSGLLPGELLKAFQWEKELFFKVK